jgi:hypothetical protein
VPRDVDPRFASNENLFRAIAKDTLRQGEVKPQSLRLQISVSRSRFDSAATARLRSIERMSKFNGIAQISVANVRSICCGVVEAICVDEPLHNNDGHTLVALVTEAPPDADIEQDTAEVRVRLARHMQIVIPPI